MSAANPNLTLTLALALTLTLTLTQVRTTLNGVSAAAGKIGAAIGVAAFPYVVQAVGKGFTLVVCGGVSMLGFIITLIFVKDMRGKAMTGSEEVDDFKEEAY